MRGILFCFLAFLVFGCAKREPIVLGSAPLGHSTTVASARDTSVSTPVTLRGTMVEKCPVAGCWFNLRDDTGLIKVDTKAANFVVLNVPLQTTVLVSGRLTTNGS